MPREPGLADLKGLMIDHLLRDGLMWIVVRGVPGWDRFEIRLRATMAGAEPTVTALQIEPIGDEDGLDLTGFKLRSLPIKALARAALDWGPDVYRDALSSLQERGGTHDPRAATTVQEFAAKWLEGHEGGKPAQAYARDALHLSQSTAERYARRARSLGLIPETKRSKARGQVPSNREESE